MPRASDDALPAQESLFVVDFLFHSWMRKEVLSCLVLPFFSPSCHLDDSLGRSGFEL